MARPATGAAASPPASTATSPSPLRWKISKPFSEKPDNTSAWLSTPGEAMKRRMGPRGSFGGRGWGLWALLCMTAIGLSAPREAHAGLALKALDIVYVTPMAGLETVYFQSVRLDKTSGLSTASSPTLLG